MEILKNIFRFIITIILTVSICAFFIINIISSTILSKDYVFAKLDETDYYNKIYEYVNSNFEKYIYQSGLDESVIKNLFTVDQVKADTQKILNNIYDGTQEVIDTESIRQNLNTNIKAFIGEKNFSTQQTEIHDFVETICSEYANSISHYKYEKKINDGYSQILEYVAKFKKAMIISILVSAMLLLIINIKSLYQFITYVGVSGLASGLFLIFANIYIKLKIDIKNILILNNAISDTLISIATQLLGILMKYGCIFTIAGLLLIIISTFIHNARNKNVEEKK